jgi:hypothetical protein
LQCGCHGLFFSAAITILVNLLITGPLLALLSDALESIIRASLLKDLKVLEPAFKSEGECTLNVRVFP